ncbi:MAG: ribbon-helix-helix domain-containing protein [Nitrospirota bacterium]|nr:ribbon-helix-helix domain-containing protein [Nitrospirota bacterium]
MDRQNVTLSLPKALLKQAKIVAAQEEKSLSELIREVLRGKVEQQTGYQKAKERHLSLLQKGLPLGTKGKSSYTRDELHARP